MLARQNQPQTSVPRLRRALDQYEKIIALDPDRMQVKTLAARAKASLGSALESAGNVSEGARYLKEAVEFYESAGAADTIDAHLKSQYAQACAWLASPLSKNKQSTAEARRFYEKSLDLWRDLERRNVMKHSDASKAEEISWRLAESD